jgi:2-oxoglutarate dehydrogenase E2 component (dihydrolipoamide succinyltransferase)
MSSIFSARHNQTNAKPGNNKMVIDIQVPTHTNSTTTLSIGRWFKRTGDPVSFDEPLVEIDTDTKTLEIRSPLTGILSSILRNDGASVEIGNTIGTVSQI